MYVPRSEISLRSNCGQIRSKLPVFVVTRFTHTTIWVCGKCKMFAISWIDINIILNMNIWSAQQNDNSNERTFNHTNLIISYRFGFFLEFNCEIDDFWLSTNQRSACLTKMPHMRVLRDHKSDLIRVIMFYYTICIIRNLRCTFSRYDSYHMTHIIWPIPYDPTVWFETWDFHWMRSLCILRYKHFWSFHRSQTATRSQLSFCGICDRVYRAVLCRGLNFENFLDSTLFCLIGEPMKTNFCGD